MEVAPNMESLEISLRRATPEDLKTFLELERSVDGSDIYSATTDESDAKDELTRNNVYFIEKSGEVVGSIMYERKSENHVYVSGLVIRPEYQGSGIGRAAMEQVLKEIGDTERIDLVTHPDNTRAKALYESLGFTVESVKENYYGDGQPRAVMVKLRK